MRILPVTHLQEQVTQLLIQAAYQLPQDYLDALAQAQRQEASPLGQTIIQLLQENATFAQQEQVPTCQDTGMAILYLDVGQEVHFTGGELGQALEAAVRDAYAALRKSVVRDPLQRENTGDNTPPIVHFRLVPGDRVRVRALMKGFGGEMMSRLAMLTPADGREGIRRFVLETVERAGPNACPPVIVGVGLGSSFDGVAALAKEALLRPLGQPNPAPHLAQLEAELLEAVNGLGIGPQGLGGTVTALAVHVESAPTHIAALPVAVNLNCSAPRRAETVL